MDIEDYAKDFKHPYLILLADKDKIVDNSGAIDFHKKTGTPSDLKDLKQFYNCYH
jgi:alpha-beta hydrolase superfamily lysophospholipase